MVEAERLVMGIVNAAPDSFSDGGLAFGVDKAAHRALTLAEEGADVVDLGGESTRPGADVVSAEVELGRVIPVLRALREREFPLPISVDTYKAHVAAAALEAGASAINDVGGFSWDPHMLDVLAAFKPGYVLMHAKGRPGRMDPDPQYDDVVDEVKAFFGERLNRLVKAGLPEANILLDPGIGFGKTLEHNLALLKHIDRFMVFGIPLLVGVSRKSLFGKLLGLPVNDRDGATGVATALLAAKGVWAHRAHDAAGARRALSIAREIG